MRIFDGHCDTILRCYRTGSGIDKNDGHLDLERMEALGQCAQFFALFWSAGSKEKTPEQAFREEYAVFCRELERNADRIVQCRTAADIETAWAAGKQAAVLSVEGAELLGCDLAALEEAHAMGVRAVNLTWNYENALAGSNARSPEKGLTAAGKVFVRRMQELGMLVDVSHLSDPGFWDVIEIASKPIFASHSNARALCPHPRNLTDEQFSAIIKNGGVAGLNMCAEFVGEDPTIDTLIAHIEHWFGLGGENHVSLGGDWDGISATPRDMTGYQDLERLADRLLRMNYSQDRVDGIFYRNLLRVVREVCTM